MQAEIVGRGPGGEPVVSGAWAFFLVGTLGFPLDLVQLELRGLGAAFDVCGFVDAALEDGWTPRRVRLSLAGASMPAEALALLDGYLRMKA